VTAPSRRPSRPVSLLALGMFGAFGVWVAILSVGFPDPWDPSRFQTVPDAAADWMAVRAAFDGVDPYLELDRLGTIYGIEVDPLPPGASNPRFPGGMLLLAPLLLVGVGNVTSLMTVVNLLTLGMSGWLLARWWGTLVPLMVLPPLAVTPPFVELVAHGPHIGPMTLGLVVAWRAAQRQRQEVAGLVAGALALVRGFPLLLLAAFWRGGRLRASVVGLGAFVALNLAGMAWFGITPSQVVRALSASSAVFGTDAHNASMAGMLVRIGVDYQVAVVAGGGLVLLAWLGVLRLVRDLDGAMAVTVPAMLLASPLSWPTYQYLLLPVVAWLAARGRRRSLILLGGVAVAGWWWWVRSGVAVSGVATFLLYLGFGVVAAIAARRSPAVTAGSGSAQAGSAA
jgi:hypothetical protein